MYHRLGLAFTVYLLSGFPAISTAQAPFPLEQGPSEKGPRTALSAGSNSIQNAAKQRIQNRLLAPITVTLKNATLGDALEAVAKQAGLRLAFGEHVLRSSKSISLDVKKASAESVIGMILRGTGLQYRITGPNEIVIEPSAAPDSLKKTTISGAIIDSATRKGIVGATVTVVGTELSAVTQERGLFRILNVPVGMNTISIKMLGYQTKTIETDADSNRSKPIVVVLRQTTTTLSEVVTTAIGQQRRVEVGNDIVKLNATQILERTPARSVSDMLRYAQVPGVQVLTASGEPGAPTRIRMRGIGSISQNTDPAIIVDGVWVSSDMSSKNIVNQAGGGGYGRAVRYTSSPLDEIDPENIESIEIIRGPSAASLYGQEASNGVIVITTKRGQVGQTTWTYSYARDWDNQTREKFPSWISYGMSANGTLRQGCNVQQHYEQLCTQDSVFNLNQFGSLLDETGPAVNSRHSISVRGGTNAITYSFSAAHQNQLGTDRTVPADLIRLRTLGIPYSNDLKNPTEDSRLFLNSSFAFNPSQRLTFDITMNATNANLRQDGVIMQGNTNNFQGYWDTLGIVRHSSATVELNRGGSRTFSLQSALQAQYISGSWWNARGQIGVDRGEREDYLKREFRECHYGLCEPVETDGLRRFLQKTNVITGRSSASGVLSTRWDRFLSIRPSIGIDFKRNLQDQVTLGLKKVPLGADRASGDGTGTIFGNDIITAGIYLNTTFRVLDRLNFDFGWRQDAGSVIQSNSFSRFPKLATSWLLSDEGFFPENSVVTQLRLRGAAGYAAVHPEAADLKGGYKYATSIINGVETVIGELSTIGNNRLVPERSFEVEGGVDADLFGDRVQLVFTMAHKVLRNAIIDRGLPTSAGIGISGGRRENIARVDNRSIEFSINSRIIDNDKVLFQFETGMSAVNNVIKKLGDQVRPSSGVDRLEEGYQVGSVWYQPMLGYGDVDNNGYVDASEIVLGDTAVYRGWSLPKFTASYRPSLSIFNRKLTLTASFAQTGPRVQRLTYENNYGIEVVGSPIDDQAISRANTVLKGLVLRTSEIRWTSSSINYTLPTSFTRRMNAKLITVSLQGSNLALWTNYSGRDPMVNSTPIGNAISDNGFTLPLPRRYALNVRLNW